MATHSPPKDHFVSELSRVREEIKQKFKELIDCIKAREDELLRELDSILTSYYLYYYRDVIEKQKVEKPELEKMIEFHQNEIGSSPVKFLSDNVLIDRELESIEIPTKPNIVHFIFDNDRIITELNKLGELVENVEYYVDYKSKVLPVVSVCKKGYGKGELNYPRGVTVDNTTGNIYIADQENLCIKVFNLSGSFLFKFGNSDGVGKMHHPRSLTLCGERILISSGSPQSSRECAILNYQLNGQFISRIGKFGQGKLEFNFPCELACNQINGDIYICDNGNNRIQVISRDFTFKSEFGSAKLKFPRDVKLSKQFIFILDTSNLCMHLYDYNRIPQISFVPRGEGMRALNPYFFYLDNSSNILISDYPDNSIHVFNQEFVLFHKINTSTHPMGVVVDNQGRVIVVCQADRDCLQIF